MPGAERPPHVARFGSFELDVRAGELRPLDGGPVRLPEQSLRILILLLEHPGEVVQREEIQKKLWPNDTIVEFEHSISAAMNRLRQALGDYADKPKYVETLARRGYRWMVPVEWVDGTPALQPSTAAEKKTPESPDGRLIGRKVSHYRVLQILGGGGMGVVYEAEDLKLGRRVALKFLPEELGADPAALHRFESEARAASTLNHPNICTIYGVEEFEGQPFLVMELLEGQTLRDLMVTNEPGKPAVELTKLLDLAVQITAGLDAAHQQGIIHRDIKPANIFATSRGQAKILDFGLAKLLFTGATAAGSPATDHRENDRPHEPQYETGALTASSPFLSRTGVAMGTAGYMSPEQVRGEKLDARTDLFSFGLVLYEMATGQRAFTGDTSPVLREAILKQIPAPVRDLNRAIPAKLGRIITKAIEKDRNTRYQTAAELHADLEAVKHEMQPRRTFAWPVLAGGVFVVSLAVAFFWFSRHRLSVADLPEPKLRQLTINSFENRVTSGAISPDGKYLAYTDTKGLYVKLIESAETHLIPQPESLHDRQSNWALASWFPDSTHFLANAIDRGPNDWPDSLGSSVWIASVPGGPPHKLRDDALAYSVSPDGSLISFSANKGHLGDREIWLMDTNGEHARKLFEVGEDGAFWGINWAPDGERITYVKTDATGDSLLSGDLSGGSVLTLMPPSELKNVDDFVWLPDGQFVHSVIEHEWNRPTCKYWEERFDTRTGKRVEKPRQLKNWPQACMHSLFVTRDGKRLAFLEREGHPTVNLADIALGNRQIKNLRHFTLSESSDFPMGWASDSKNIFLLSSRNGPFTVYRQPLEQDSAEQLATLPDPFYYPVLTPDLKWILFIAGKSQGPPVQQPIMKIPVSGSSPVQVFIARFNSALMCARAPSNLCLIAEPTDDRKEMIFSVLDAFQGRGAEVARFGLDPNDDGWQTDLSPNGSQIAFLRGPAGPLSVFSLRDHSTREIPLKGLSNLRTLNWSSNNDGLFVSDCAHGNTRLLYLNLRGESSVLEERSGAEGTGVKQSPDGRHLAISAWTLSGNMWLRENF
jgi:serine/threonine protein kinase